MDKTNLPPLPEPNRKIDGYAMFNDTQMIEYAAAALRATTGEGEWVGPYARASQKARDFANVMQHGQTVHRELPHPVSWPDSHGSTAAPTQDQENGS